jgi:hypothetical protein
MSEYTDSLSPRPGYPGGAGSDDRAMFLKEFAQMVLEAWQEVNTFGSFFHSQNVSTGKSWQFPIIGRKRDAFDHDPGEIVLGGGIENNEIEITLDKMLVDAVFLAEIDELMASYSLRAPYARQLGESLSTTSDRRAAIMAVLASRVVTAPYTGGPVPSYYYDAAIKTDPSKLEEAHFAAVQFINEIDEGGGQQRSFLPWQQLLLLSKYSDLDKVATSGSASRANATVGPVAGINITGSNHLPKTNITGGLTKYTGDFTTSVGFIANPQGVGLLRRRGMRVTVTDKEDRLGTLIIASKLEGWGKLRPECVFELATAVRT